MKIRSFRLFSPFRSVWVKTHFSKFNSRSFPDRINITSGSGVNYFSVSVK